VLARLRRIPEIADARVECSGTFFALSFRERADGEAVLRAALEALGPTARRLASDDALAQLEARRRNEIWFSADDIRGLSFIEGRIIAMRAFAAVAGEVRLEREASELLREALRIEVFGALDRVHDEGGRSSSGWFVPAWPGIVAGVMWRLGDTLPATTLARVSEKLMMQHAPGAVARD
jgi:hypothetical protein